MGRSDNDIFRDTKLRYLGYANEVGEAFRAVVSSNVVKYSYYVAFGYVVADTMDKSWKALRNEGRIGRVLSATGDALIWQTLASVVIPGITINRICAFSGYQLGKRAQHLPPNTRRWITVGIGLASIPFIVKPIDTAVTIFMEMTYRKIF